MSQFHRHCQIQQSPVGSSTSQRPVPAPLHTVGVEAVPVDDLRDEVAGHRYQERVHIDGDDGERLQDVRPPPDVLHVLGNGPPVVNQKLLGIKPENSQMSKEKEM